jgi:hypothetical protein
MGCVTKDIMPMTTYRIRGCFVVSRAESMEASHGNSYKDGLDQADIQGEGVQEWWRRSPFTS